ncbi:3-oxoacyl-[acyl-carrier-protein] synthase 3 [Lentzea sp. NBRC 105346]|uniref:beta-ketoacyl-ACP synthase III n=1 Tax=Lentzea sp. NBRC 105346 TaxID=3032205 RepID=UPI0024A490E4|nr:beta-ketoacyl-ACP synthase III [Lentzea sp. NBRC 105346]GLZ29333.1 3-oxoacyl-[acyl-carrier-protein] synthase 3 [Lentzea sp. NBRC 105346]
MITARTPAAVLCGVGGYVPPKVVTNDDLAARLDTSDEWIRSRVGIHQRHVVEPGTATSDLAVRAAEAALQSAGTRDIDVVVLATTTPDHPCPATAPTVAQRLGLGCVPAFDVSAVCSGFVYGLAVTAGMIASGLARHVLLIGAEAYTTILDPYDRATVSVFGDGAGAVVVRAGEPGELGAVQAFDLGSDGGLAELIMTKGGGARHPRPDAADSWFAMQGQAVYRHAVRRMVGSSRAVLDAVGWKPQDVDRFVGHQANRRILDAVARELEVAPESAVINIDRVGNTAGASIPLALADAVATGELLAGDKVLLTAFGGGATWGSSALTWPALRAA